MKIKFLSFLTAFLFVLSLAVPQAYAAGGKEAAASFFLPTTGQAMNGELGTRKAQAMAGIEFAAITATTLIGLTTGGAAVLFGAIPLAANHVWSSMDAGRVAKQKSQYSPANPIAYQQMIESQKAMEMSRQDRFDQEEQSRPDFRERMRAAAEPAN